MREHQKEAWTGELIAKMHISGVTRQELADELQCTKAYVTMILNGFRNPDNAQERLNSAFEAVLQKREGQA